MQGRNCPTHEVFIGERLWESTMWHYLSSTQRDEVRKLPYLHVFTVQNFRCAKLLNQHGWTKCLNSQCCFRGRGKTYSTCPHFWKQHLCPLTNISSSWRAYTTSKGGKGTSARKDGRSTLVERAILSWIQLAMMICMIRNDPDIEYALCPSVKHVVYAPILHILHMIMIIKKNILHLQDLQWFFLSFVWSEQLIHQKTIYMDTGKDSFEKIHPFEYVFF